MTNKLVLTRLVDRIITQYTINKTDLSYEIKKQIFKNLHISIKTVRKNYKF